MANITIQPGSVTLDGVEFSVKDENPFVDLYTKAEGQPDHRVQMGFDGTKVTYRIQEAWNRVALVFDADGNQVYPAP